MHTYLDVIIITMLKCQYPIYFCMTLLKDTWFLMKIRAKLPRKHNLNSRNLNLISQYLVWHLGWKTFKFAPYYSVKWVWTYDLIQNRQIQPLRHVHKRACVGITAQVIIVEIVSSPLIELKNGVISYITKFKCQKPNVWCSNRKYRPCL